MSQADDEMNPTPWFFYLAHVEVNEQARIEATPEQRAALLSFLRNKARTAEVARLLRFDLLQRQWPQLHAAYEATCALQYLHKKHQESW